MEHFKPEQPKPLEETNKFSEMPHSELLQTLQSLQERRDDLQSQIMSYDNDDKYALEHDYNTTLMDINHVEDEIERRAINN